MSVFKKKTDIFTPENKKIRIEKTKNTQIPHKKSGLCVFKNKEKMQKKSRPRLLGSKESMQTVSCPRLSGKVSAELTKGASVSRNAKNIFCDS